MERQLSLFEVEIETKLAKGKSVQLLPLDEYDHILVSLSSGKDSVTCTLLLLEMGVPRSKFELYHQSVDGNEVESNEFFDWPITAAYTQAFGDLLGIPVRYQWREGGILGEMMRKDSLTGPVYYVSDDGEIVHLPTTKGNSSTRLKWPAMSADLRVRWCSASAKIDVFRRVLNNHPKFKGTVDHPTKVLVISGERREESPNRAKYLEAELHPTNTRSRIVHWWRPVIDYRERDIWDMYEKHRLLPHMAYLIGYNRTSCFSCVFQTPDLWAIMREIAPDRFRMIVEKEKELGHTIDPRMDVVTKAKLGSLDRLSKDARVSKWVGMALSRSITKDDLIMNRWELPAGAFRGASGGPS